MDEEASSSKAVSDEGLGVRSQDGSKELEDHSTVEYDSSPHLRKGISGSEFEHETRIAHIHSNSNATSPVFHSKNSVVKGIDQYLPAAIFEIEARNTTASDRPYKSGNIYNSVGVSADARAHLGDVVTINHYYDGSTEAKGKQIVTRIEITEECFTTFLAAIALVREMLQTATGLLVLLQVTMSAYRLPKQISDRIATFEDALGGLHKIDLMFINSWPAFRESLESDFQGTPGSRRIFTMKYRLSDRVRGDYLVDPRHPPPFTSLFKEGRHVQMSMHFEWDEVSDEQCPRCSFTQEGRGPLAAETICARCRFSYRTLVEGRRIEEVDDDGNAFEQDTRDDSETACSKTEQRDHDEPAYFSRITISRKPMHTCGNCSESYSRMYDLNRHVCRHRRASDGVGRQSPLSERSHASQKAQQQRCLDILDRISLRCKSCSLSYSSLDSFNRHKLDVHGSTLTMSPGITCGECSENYSRIYDFIDHVCVADIEPTDFLKRSELALSYIWTR